MKTTYVAALGVFLLTSCGHSRNPAATINQAASLPASASLEKQGLKVLATYVNRQQATTSTLYGNDLARQATLAATHPLPAGAKLTLLTWQQQEDPNWLGARIPGALLSMEQLRMEPAGAAVSYQRFDGPQLVRRSDTLHQQARIAYLLAQKPSVLP
jgi:hypothetical protein